jgi:hypothetical protein
LFIFIVVFIVIVVVNIIMRVPTGVLEDRTLRFPLAGRARRLDRGEEKHQGTI